MKFTKIIKFPVNFLYSNLVEFKQRKKLKKLYSFFVQKGDLVFDIGANIGEHSKIFGSLGTKVIAIEPTRELNKKIRKNSPRAIIINKGVGSKKEFTKFKKFKDSGHNTFYKDNPKLSEQKFVGTEEIEIITLSKLMNDFGIPKFIKIDVEGFEWEVIQTLDKPVKYISFEFTQSIFEVAKECIDFLEKKGYEFNWTYSIFNRLIERKWLNSENLKKRINKNNLFGMIYARLKKRNDNMGFNQNPGIDALGVK
jgi:FkbM family methyltransferase